LATQFKTESGYVSFRIVPGDADLEQYTASLATTSGRQKLNFIVPHYATHYTGYPVDSADLLYRKGNFWLHVVVTIPDPDVTSNGEAVGVDLGLTHPAVTSNRQFLGKKHWKEVDRKYFRIQRALQAKGTKSARKHLRKLSGTKATVSARL
jgi:putative transposase